MSVLRRRGLLVDDPLAAGHDPSPAPSVTGASEIAGRLRDIPVADIRANPAQPRKRFDASALAALAESIRERGVLQPVIVRPVESGYEVVAGERRWRAAELAGEATIPALVDDALDQAGSLELALIENIVREDLSPIEQARTFSVLLDDLRMTSAILAKRIGRSREDIANTMRLLALPDEVIEMIDSRALTKGHGKVLLMEPDHHRRLALARQATERGWSVRALERKVARATEPHHRPSPDADQCAVATRLEEAITRATGCEATAKPHRRGFQILLDHPAADRLVRALGADIGAL